MWTDLLPAALTVFGSIMGAEGSSSAGNAARVAAASQKSADDFQADQLDQNAGQQIAASQRVALEAKRQATFVKGRQLAIAAASGAGASDPTIINIIAATEGENAVQQAMALYQGEEAARQMRLQAAGLRVSGQNAVIAGDAKATAARYSAAGSLITGAGSLFARYGMGGPAGKVNTSPIDAAGINWDNV